ncbi:MAG: HD domain-containing protein [Candidatus Hydrothermarchaeota archaeon]|nr:HD domain-containing protein [Candidatus Hydrothermarchaeota archaeon]
MKQFIKDLEFGRKVESKFSVKYRHPPREYMNGFMFVTGLADKTGEIEATYWGGKNLEKVRNVYESFREGDVVYVSGTVGEFRDKLKIDINEGEGIIRKTEEYEIEDFIAESERNLEEMASELREIMSSIGSPHLKSLLDSFFGDAKFFEEFKKAPAAMYIHHACIGGLLEHTLNVAKLCEAAYSLYPQLDRDLLMAGAILHDVGKLREFKATTNIKISEEGMLRGHIIIGDELVQEKIKSIGEFPENLGLKLSHIILSHHGSNEYQSPKEPQFPEAVAVHYADELDAKLYQYMEIKEKAKESNDFRAYSKRLGGVYLK